MHPAFNKAVTEVERLLTNLCGAQIIRKWQQNESFVWLLENAVSFTITFHPPDVLSFKVLKGGRKECSASILVNAGYGTWVYAIAHAAIAAVMSKFTKCYARITNNGAFLSLNVLLWHGDDASKVQIPIYEFCVGWIVTPEKLAEGIGRLKAETFMQNL